MPNVLSPRDLVSRSDNMDKTVLSSYGQFCSYILLIFLLFSLISNVSIYINEYVNEIICISDHLVKDQTYSINLIYSWGK